MKKLLLFFTFVGAAFSQQTEGNLTVFGQNVTQNSAGLNGGYIRMSPITYHPGDSPTPCMDAFGNEVQQPLPTAGAAPFGTNDLVLWNSLSPLVPPTGCGAPPLPVNLIYGINTNGYFFARGGLATDQNYYNSLQSLYGGVLAGSFTAGIYYNAGQNTLRLGTVNTTNGSSGSCSTNCVTVVNGNQFNSGIGGLGITINSVSFTIGSYVDANHISLTTAPGTQSSVPYSLTAPITVGAYLGGHTDTGHSSGPPTCTGGYPCLSSDRDISTAVNPLTGGEGLVQGMMYWDDILGCENVYNGTSWTCLGGGGGTPGSPTNSVQFNSAGSFGGSSNFLWNNSTQTLVIMGSAISGVDAPAFSSTNTGPNPAFTTMGGTFYINGDGSAGFNNAAIGLLGSALTGVGGGTGIGNALLSATTTGLYVSLNGGAPQLLGTATAPGVNNDVIYNSGGNFAANGNFTYASSTLTIAGVTGSAGDYTNGMTSPIFNCTNTVTSGGSNAACVQQAGGAFKIFGDGEAQFQTTAMALGASSVTGVGGGTGIGNALFSATTAGMYVSINGGTPQLLGTATAPGSNDNVIYNNGGGFGASSSFNFASSTLTISGAVGSTGDYSNGMTAPVFNCTNTVSSGGSNVPCLQQSSGVFKIFGNGDAQFQQMELTGGLTVNTSYGLTSAGVLTVASCTGCGGSGSPSLPYNSVQYNNAGAFGGSSNFTYLASVGELLIGTSGTTPSVAAPLVNAYGSSGECLEINSNTAQISCAGAIQGQSLVVTGGVSVDSGVYYFNSGGTLSASVVNSGTVSAITSAGTAGSFQSSSGIGVYATSTYNYALEVSGSSYFTGSLTGSHVQNLGTTDGPSFTGVTGTSLGGSFTDTATNYGIHEADTGGGCNIGTAYLPSGIGCSSDERLKKNIHAIGPQIANVMLLNPVTFDWRSNNKPALGFIAQEVQKIYPNLISQGENGYLMMSTNGVVPYLVKAIQEQQKEIEQLKKQNKRRFLPF